MKPDAPVFKAGERAHFHKVAQFRGHSVYAGLTAAEVATWKMYLKLEGLAGYRLVGELIRGWIQECDEHYRQLTVDGRPPRPPGAGPAGQEGRRQTIEDLSED